MSAKYELPVSCVLYCSRRTWLLPATIACRSALFVADGPASDHEVWIWLPEKQIPIGSGKQIRPWIVAYNSSPTMSR